MVFSPLLFSGRIFFLEFLLFLPELFGGISLMKPSEPCVVQENTCQGLLLVNWAQIHNQSLLAIVYRCLSPKLPMREKLQTWLPRIHLSSRGLRLSLSNQSCLPISLFTFSLTKKGSILTNLGGAIWTNQTKDLESSVLSP